MKRRPFQTWLSPTPCQENQHSQNLAYLFVYGILFVYYLIPTRSRWYYEVEVEVLLEQTDTVVFVSCILACFATSRRWG